MMMFRPATAADLSALNDLIDSAFRGERSRAGWTTEADLLGGQRTDPELLAAILADPDQCLLLAEAAPGAPVGCVLVMRKPDAIAGLGMLTVAPAQQGGGLGRQLVAAAEQHARAVFGAATLEMRVIRQRAELIAWYQRLGYADTGRTEPFPYGDARFGLPKRDDLAFVVLAKPLA